MRWPKKLLLELSSMASHLWNEPEGEVKPLWDSLSKLLTLLPLTALRFPLQVPLSPNCSCLGQLKPLKYNVWGHTWPASRPSLSSNRAPAMYTASTEYWTISKIRYKEKKTELKCLMAYLYTFTNSQQKRWQVTHPFCMLTILMHIDVNTHAWMMHTHMAT